jgi:UDP-hydrolysing UDP-N-acetyl-D-glucosamine 2-epimerase
MRIAVPTSTRADFGILYPLINVLQDDPFFELSLIATGSHLDESRGNTINEIIESGFGSVIKMPIDIADTTELGVILSAGKTLQSTGLIMSQRRPDMVLILGDRYEMLSIAFSCFLFRIPIVHISGGDLTSGSLDDSIRHAITKLSSLHFTTTEIYRKRVIQLGEEPSKVFNTGNLCIDNVKNLNTLSKEVLEKELGFSFSKFKKNILVTLHSETNSQNQNIFNREFFDALAKLDDVGILITYPNHDANSSSIIKEINNLSKRKPEQIVVNKSLGMLRYHSVLKIINCVVGNSSSGITEVASYGIPTVNVGNRQKGRVCSSSVIHTKYKADEIYQCIRNSLSSGFIDSVKPIINPYGDGSTALRMINILKNTNPENLASKEFFDIEKTI